MSDLAIGIKDTGCGGGDGNPKDILDFKGGCVVLSGEAGRNKSGAAALEPLPSLSLKNHLQRLCLRPREICGIDLNRFNRRFGLRKQRFQNGQASSARP